MPKTPSWRVRCGLQLMPSHPSLGQLSAVRWANEGVA